MTRENNESGVRISSWTLATGTRPGERYVYGAASKNTTRPSAPEAKS